jgi:hypothetical protein
MTKSNREIAVLASPIARDMVLCSIFGVSCGREGEGDSPTSEIVDDCDVAGVEVAKPSLLSGDFPTRFTALSNTVLISSSVSRSRTKTLSRPVIEEGISRTESLTDND